MNRIKTGIKLQVTPEESKQVQEICFANDIEWCYSGKCIQFTDKSYLFIDDWITYSTEMYFTEHYFEEVDAKFFIKTNGLCIEENQEQELKQNIKEEQMKDNELETYKDVKEYLVAKGLYDRVMEIEWYDEVEEYYHFSDLYQWAETEEGDIYWSEIDDELIELDINMNIESLVQDKATAKKEFIQYPETQPKEDEYKELRKALSKGKIIQLNGTAVNGGYGETWNDCKQDDLFIYDRSSYRVKPEAKPKQYLVFVPSKGKPKHLHQSLESAQEEAHRLCKSGLCEVMVLEVVSKYQAKVIVEEV